MQKALLIGIDFYQNNKYNLKGCVNDVNAFYRFLIDKVGFEHAEIKTLVNAEATRINILKHLSWLVFDADAGDKLLFYYSGHGYKIKESADNSDEPDGMDEAICPYDFNWLRETNAIIDDEFYNLFSVVPKEASFVWISDSCHSGDLSESGHKHKKGLFTTPVTVISNNVALIAGCRSDQKSGFLFEGGDFHGVLTYHLLETLKAPGGLEMPLTDVMKKVKKAVKKGDFKQDPQLEGSDDQMQKTFLSLKTI